MRRQLWRAVSAFRVVALVYAAVLVVADCAHYRRPSLAWALLAVMAAWTVLTMVVVLHRRVAPSSLLVADVGVAVAMVVATRLVETGERIAHGAPTLPAAWAAAPVLACALSGGPVWGSAAAVAVSAADVVERRGVTQHTFNGVVLLLVAGAVGGYVVRLAVAAEHSIAVSARREAVADERDRLARDIHDSVLQVLALVARRGRAIGGETAELAALAGQQEVALRALVGAPPPDTSTGEVDLRTLLEPLGGARVAVSGPAGEVLLPRPVADAVAGAVRAALDNVERHAGEGARAWLLIEVEPREVVVTVRDDGRGLAEGRLPEAREQGRLGVAASIESRVAAVGGRAAVTSTVGAGTEVELRVPRG